MDMNQFMQDLDQLFIQGKVDEVGDFLETHLQIAKNENDPQAEAAILNELVGFFRDISDYDKSLDYAGQAVKKLQDMGMTDSIPYATTLLNAATAYRAAGQLETSLAYFKQILPIYQKHLQPDDMLIASYYNNLALLYQEMQDHAQACTCLQEALNISGGHADALYEQATTHANLGISLVRTLHVDEGIAHLRKALSTFEQLGEKGYHYGAALSGMGEAMYCKDDYDASIRYYEQAAQVIKNSYGENQAYHIMIENIEAVKADLPKQDADVNAALDHLIEQIVAEEWRAFGQVQNEGGRADCQDDYETFSIMRKSQYMTWTKPLLSSYLDDLLMAASVGENLISYKYGYMMESTAPEEYADMKDKLPVVEPERRALIDQIVSIQVSWMEAFAKQYPALAANARSIHTYEDSKWNTSAETYLRGELMTYSDTTLKLYGQFVVSLAREGKNLNAMIMENTVHMYGYASLEDAQQKKEG